MHPGDPTNRECVLPSEAAVINKELFLLRSWRILACEQATETHDCLSEACSPSQYDEAYSIVGLQPTAEFMQQRQGSLVNVKVVRLGILAAAYPDCDAWAAGGRCVCCMQNPTRDQIRLFAIFCMLPDKPAAAAAAGRSSRNIVQQQAGLHVLRAAWGRGPAMGQTAWPGMAPSLPGMAS